MNIHDLQQGSDEWRALRLNCYCASEAPVMMGASSKMKRNELIRMKATGAEKEFSDWVQRNLLDKGHEVEARARAFAEEIIGEELFPITATDNSGVYLSSFDGMTMDETVSWEHKLWNEELVAAVRAKELPAENYWQLEHQLMTGGHDRVLFMVSDGTRENCVFMWYKPVPGRRASLIASWDQFEEDCRNYEYTEDPVEVVGKAPASLPTLLVEITGEVKSTNLATYKDVMLQRIREINTDLQTDEDFADAAKTVSFLEEGEKEIERVKARALAQTISIDELFRAVDELSAEMRAKRLNLNRLVEARKKEIRDEIRKSGIDRLRIFMEGINAQFAEHGLTITVTADFAGAMKSKRTVASLRDAVDTELARAKIAATEQSNLATANLAVIERLGSRHPFLFADKRNLLLKPTADLTDIVQSRVINHEAEEKRKQDAERERIRQEELQRIEREAEEQRCRDAVAVETVISDAPEIMDASDEHFSEEPPEQQPTAASAALSFSDRTSAASAAAAAQTSNRPSDQEIINAIAKSFGVHQSVARTWLSEMQLKNVA